MENSQSDVSSAPAPAGCLLRLFWMLVGNGLLYLSLVLIASRHAPLPSYLDVIAGAAVLAMIGARRVDIVRFGGRTVQDEPASLADWRRFSLLLVVVAAVSWLIAHFISGNLG
ncbi:hypothetical protein [Nannocystis sp.]|uniref:hypothetical protein n=1 Tax=Nannocystis sp. TaxID=1962667 RepID=UPI002426E2EE|nr:hypothetical protein [Nannocystis sp.]MBK7825607.1 hypothetical protein [Nannocystis sp.]MBK9756683.1 hypothetical protein [Nannocystis sp.]